VDIFDHCRCISGMAIDEAALRTALAQTGQGRGPGLLGLVTEGGRVVFEGSVGVADLRQPRPIDVRDQFRIGSVTKVYVATLVLQLIADGALSLTDPVDRWLPDRVPDGDVITVDLLLRLRSGLPDYVGLIFGDPPELSVLDGYWSPEQLVAAALTGPDRLPPDTGFRYSNTDYINAGTGSQTAGNNSGSGGKGRDGECRNPQGAEIPCQRDGGWAGADGCYYKPTDVSPSTIAALGGQPAGEGGWYQRGTSLDQTGRPQPARRPDGNYP
jgi:hypothetical protein